MVYLYTCAFSNSEMFSDAYDLFELHNGYIIGIKSSIVDKKADKFDMGDCEDVVDADTRVNEIVDSFRYNESPFTKSQFTAWFKGYVKAILGRMKEQGKDEDYIKGFQTNATDFAKFVLGKIDDFTFYLNEDNNMDGALAMSYWADTVNDKGPTFLYFKDGMIKQKI